MNFPKKFLWFPVGWSDRGRVEGKYKSERLRRYEVHAFCNTTAHIGKEEGELFKFCPRCLVKIEPSLKQTV